MIPFKTYTLTTALSPEILLQRLHNNVGPERERMILYDKGILAFGIGFGVESVKAHRDLLQLFEAMRTE